MLIWACFLAALIAITLPQITANRTETNVFQAKMTLTNTEIKRYARHFNLPQFGMEAQEKLKAAKVLAVGAGGLGAPVLQYLTAAGVGTLGIIDADTIEISNLQRQVLYNETDIGFSKTQKTIERLQKQNSEITFIGYQQNLSSINALEIIKQYDLIIDGTDNFPTRYLINDACTLLDKPFVYGSIFQYEGQVSVFNVETENGRSTNYRDLFPQPPKAGSIPNCADGGVLGVLPGIIGTLQALEAIKLITCIGETLVNKLYLFNALNFTSHKIKIQKNSNNPKITKLIDYEAFCGIEKENNTMVKEISVKELKLMIDNNEAHQLIDVREDYEYEQANIDGLHIPMGEVDGNKEQINTDKKVVIMCRSGMRSANIITMLETKYGMENLYNLKGGIIAWGSEIDPNVRP